MNKQEWVDARAEYVQHKEGASERTAKLLASEQAKAHERWRGSDVATWPAPRAATIFNTDGAEHER